MFAWQLLCIIGVCFTILEMFTPSMFFLNFALAAFITAAVSFYIKNPYALVFIFVILSFLSFVFLRPLIIKRKSKETGVNEKYIGQFAKVIEDISSTSGVITIYGERWEARTEAGAIIPVGSVVKILKNDSIVMYVEKSDK